MMTSSAKRTLTGLVFNLAFLAALMNADLGDFWRERRKTKQRFKGHFKGSLPLEMSHVFFSALHNSRTCSLLEKQQPHISDAINVALCKSTRWRTPSLPVCHWDYKERPGKLKQLQAGLLELLRPLSIVENYTHFVLLINYSSLAAVFFNTQHSSCWACETLWYWIGVWRYT